MNLKDVLVFAAIGILFYFIDDFIAKKIISIFGNIKFFNHFYSGPIVGLIISYLIFTPFINVSTEIFYKYRYIVAAFGFFLAGIPLQIYFIQGKY